MHSHHILIILIVLQVMQFIDKIENTNDFKRSNIF